MTTAAMNPPAVKFPSYVDAVLRHAANDPFLPAIGTDNGILSYGQLAQAVVGALVHCERAGITKGMVVGLVIEDEIWHITLVCALHRLGAVSVSLGPGEAGLDLGMGAILCDRNRPQGFAGQLIEVKPDWFAMPAVDFSQLPIATLGRNELCRIALSSGTTGAPKAIAMSPEILWHRFTTYGMRGRFSRSEKILCGPQLRSHFGFAVAFSALIAGKMVCFTNSADATVPIISYFGVDLAVISVHQLTELADVQRRNFGGLSTLREIQAGGSKISDALFNKIRSSVACPVLNTYASTEAGTAALASIGALGDRRERGAVGFLVPWADVSACDENGQPVPADTIGNLRVSAIGMAPTYVPGMTVVEEPAAFYPGDIGFVTKDKLLYIEGRTSELINIGGNKIAPESIEKVVLECSGVRDAAAYAVTGKTELPQVIVVVVAGEGFDPKAVMKRCGERLGILTPSVIRVVNTIPRSVTGKIMYAELRRQIG
jgi:acyl-coenzyme A synthetase/AMP-(fatty) acid ligase